MSETMLHAGLKKFIFQPGDMIEAQVDGYKIDILRGDLCIEIQTRNFAAIKKKLVSLLKNRPVLLIYPVSYERTIIRVSGTSNEVVRKRKSPKRGSYLEVFNELIRIPELVRNEQFSILVLLIHEEQTWKDDGLGSWRRGRWSISGKRLVGVVESRLFAAVDDYRSLLPQDLPEPFTVRDFARLIKKSPQFTRKAVYCLREMGLIIMCGKRGRAYLYRIL